MILNPLNIGHYLLQDGLLSTSQLVDEEYTIHHSDSRNCNFIINKYGDQSLFVKQVKTLDSEKVQTIKREATCYWLAKNEIEFKAWKAIMPAYKMFDRHNHILVTAYINSVSLNDHIKTNKDYLSQLGNKLADVLFDCHDTKLPALLKERYSNYFPCEKPFVFQLAANQFSSGWRVQEDHQKELFDLIMSDPNYLKQMNEVSMMWSGESVIHNDVKFQNFLVDQDQDIRLIDWEICDIGDPRWDLAAVFHMFLIAWMTGQLMDEKKSKLSNQLTLSDDQMQSALNQFWHRYSSRSGWDNAQSNQWLRDTLKYCSLKLVHTSFEITNQTENVDGYVSKVLQLGLNILKDEEEVLNELIKIKI